MTTPAQAIEITVATFVTRPEAERLAIIEKVRFDAGEVDGMGHPEQHQKQFSKALLVRLEQADNALTQAQRGEVRPPLPTPAETNAFLLWAGGLLAKIGGGLAVIGSGLYLVGALVIGTGNAFMAGALANSEAIFYGICGLVGMVVAVAAYRNWPKSEETPGGETPAQNQTIINVYSATGGDVTVNNLKTQFNGKVRIQPRHK